MWSRSRRAGIPVPRALVAPADHRLVRRRCPFHARVFRFFSRGADLRRRVRGAGHVRYVAASSGLTAARVRSDLRTSLQPCSRSWVFRRTPVHRKRALVGQGDPGNQVENAPITRRLRRSGYRVAPTVSWIPPRARPGARRPRSWWFTSRPARWGGSPAPREYAYGEVRSDPPADLYSAAAGPERRQN